MVNSSCELRTRSCRSTRLQRNLAEKQRRYKLNSYISELANIVPMISMSSKRLDKTSILRLSAAHLRIYHSPLISHNKHSLKPNCKWRPNFLDADNIWKILEAVDGFLLLTTGSGKIMYISQSVERFIGHQHIEMIGHSLFSFIHPADVETVQNQLEKLVIASNEKNGKSNSERSSFYCRIRERCQPRSEVVTYQLIHIVGHITLTKDKSDDTENNFLLNQMNCLFKAFVRVVHTKPCTELSLNDAVEDEYVTRHSLDGTIIFSDHRLSTITGHLPHEVFGKSAYHYIIAEDVPVSLFAHKLMFASKFGKGMIVYRLRTSNQRSVYLRSSGYLQYDKSSSKIDHFVCVNKLLGDEEGENELKKFLECFTPHIHNTSVQSMFESICSAQITDMIISNGKSEKEEKKHLMISDFPRLEDVSSDGSEGNAEVEEKQLFLAKDKNLLLNNMPISYSKVATTNGTNSNYMLSLQNGNHKKHTNGDSTFAYNTNHVSTNDIKIVNRTVHMIKSANSQNVQFHYSDICSYNPSEGSSTDGYESYLSDEVEEPSTKHCAKRKQLPSIGSLQLYPSNQSANRTTLCLDSNLSVNDITENQLSNDSASYENFSPCKVFKKSLSTESYDQMSPDIKSVVPMKSWFSVNGLPTMKNNNNKNGDLIENHSQPNLELSDYSEENDSKTFANIFTTAIAASNGSCTPDCSDLLPLGRNGEYLASEL